MNNEMRFEDMYDEFLQASRKSYDGSLYDSEYESDDEVFSKAKTGKLSGVSL